MKPQTTTDSCSAQPGCCGTPILFPRREFLKLAGMTSVALMASRTGVFAGPFAKEDFLRLIPTDKKLDPAWVASLTARGEPETYSGEALQRIGMPVGGLFCGTMYLSGDGRLWLWDIFNDWTIGIEPAGTIFRGQPVNPIFGSSFLDPLHADKYLRVAQGFEIAVKSAAGEIRRSVDADPTTGFREVDFTGEYPIGVIRYSDPAMPVKVKLEAFSPFIPLDVKDSSLPVTVFSFEVTNSSQESVEVSLEGFLENAALRKTPFLDGMRRVSTTDVEGMTLVALTAEVAESTAEIRDDILFEDWSKPTFAEAGWTAEGDAFGEGPVAKTAMPPYQGDVGGDTPAVVNSHAGSAAADLTAKEAATGSLLSRPFRIERNFVRFWIGGGQDIGGDNAGNIAAVNSATQDAGRLGVRLLVDGQPVQSATGKNANPMEIAYFDVRSLEGKEARIEIVDRRTDGAWANTGAGSITFTDRPPTTNADLSRLPDAGSMALAVLGAPAEIRIQDTEKPLTEKLVGRVGRKLSLAAGQAATVNFLVAWHFPHAPKIVLGGRERHYAARFADAPAVAKFTASHFDRLASQTRLWRDTWYDSTLPYWFLNRTFANTTTLATTTCYLLDDGRFWAWEGVGCCEGTCTHVWHYAQAMARLFPEIERNHREFVDFGAALTPAGVVEYRGENSKVFAVDGQAGRILGAYRESQMTPDDTYLRRVWPGVKQALEKLIETDGDADGIVRGPLHNTLDADWYGIVPWLCGMYHAALKAGEIMATEVGDPKFAEQCRTILKAGQQNLDKLCWNEDFGYYVHIGDPARRTEVGAYDGCHIDQVLGQSWAWQVGLGDVMTRKHSRQALESLWKFNWTPDVGPFREVKTAGRWYALPGDGGMIMLSNPFAKDIEFTGPSAPTAMYFNECMSGFEHQVASHMLWEGMLTEGLAVTRAIHDRYSASLRNPYNEIECSDHYGRAMASYGSFLAACGFEYDGPKQHIGFAPRLTPENFRAAFTSAQGWGTFDQKLKGGKFQAGISVKWGALVVATLSLELPPGMKTATKVVATLDGKAVPANLFLSGGKALVTFQPQIHIPFSKALQILIS